MRRQRLPQGQQVLPEAPLPALPEAHLVAALLLVPLP